MKLLAGATAWPLAAQAQQSDRMRHIGVLTPFPADDVEGHARLTVFAQALQQSGWTVGQNVRIDYRWGPGRPETMRTYAAEPVALAPDVILASTSAAIEALLEATRTVPIVFAGIADPGRRRLCREPRAARPQRHRLYCLRIFHRRKMVGTAQGDRATCDAASHGASQPDHRAGGEAPVAGSLQCPLLRCGRRSHRIWAGFPRPVPPRGRLRRSHPQGREARRPAGAAP